MAPTSADYAPRHDRSMHYEDIQWITVLIQRRRHKPELIRKRRPFWQYRRPIEAVALRVVVEQQLVGAVAVSVRAAR